MLNNKIVDMIIKKTISEFNINTDIREELYQECWLRIWKYKKNIDFSKSESNIYAYVKKIARSAILIFLTNKKKTKNIIFNESHLTPSKFIFHKSFDNIEKMIDESEMNIKDIKNNPSLKFEKKELVDLISGKAYDCLTSREIYILEQSFFFEKSGNDIGLELGITKQRVNFILRGAKKKIIMALKN